MRHSINIFLLLFLCAISGCSQDQSGEEIVVTPGLDEKKLHVQSIQLKVSDEAVARKARSIKRLQAELVPVLNSLPVIETEAESIRRSTEEVANRAMALCVVAIKGEGVHQKVIEELIRDFKLQDVLTPKDLTFVNDPSPSVSDRIQFAWCYECYWVMLLSLGFVDDLGRPDKICDVTMAAGFLHDLGRDGFLQKARLRPQSELLDADDLLYRYDWACVNARIGGQNAPAGLDDEIVLEWHRALNWLVGYFENAKWDEVSTNT